MKRIGVRRVAEGTAPTVWLRAQRRGDGDVGQRARPAAGRVGDAPDVQRTRLLRRPQQPHDAVHRPAPLDQRVDDTAAARRVSGAWGGGLRPRTSPPPTHPPPPDHSVLLSDRQSAIGCDFRRLFSLRCFTRVLCVVLNHFNTMVLVRRD